MCQAKKAGQDAKMTPIGTQETNKSVEIEFDKISIVSLGIVGENVIDWGLS
jgi:hypothetical protein